MAEYEIVKDSDTNIDITVEGVDISGALITFILTHMDTPLSGDLDGLAADQKLVEKSVSGGGITITDAAGGVYRVDLDPADTEGLVPNVYRIITRVTVSGTTLPIETYTVRLKA